MAIDLTSRSNRRSLLTAFGAAIAGAAAATLTGAQRVLGAGDDGSVIHVGDSFQDVRTPTSLVNVSNGSTVFFAQSGGDGAAVSGSSQGGIRRLRQHCVGRGRPWLQWIGHRRPRLQWGDGVLHRLSGRRARRGHAAQGRLDPVQQLRHQRLCPRRVRFHQQPRRNRHDRLGQRWRHGPGGDQRRNVSHATGAGESQASTGMPQTAVAGCSTVRRHRCDWFHQVPIRIRLRVRRETCSSTPATGCGSASVVRLGSASSWCDRPRGRLGRSRRCERDARLDGWPAVTSRRCPRRRGLGAVGIRPA